MHVCPCASSHVYGMCMACAWHVQVSVELDGEAFQLSVGMGEVGSAAELQRPLDLKRAIVAACIAELGEALTPAAWASGQLETMAVQFLDASSGAALTMKEGTDFGMLRASRTLRVTRRQPKAASRQQPSSPPPPPPLPPPPTTPPLAPPADPATAAGGTTPAATGPPASRPSSLLNPQPSVNDILADIDI